MYLPFSLKRSGVAWLESIDWAPVELLQIAQRYLHHLKTLAVSVLCIVLCCFVLYGCPMYVLYFVFLLYCMVWYSLSYVSYCTVLSVLVVYLWMHVCTCVTFYNIVFDYWFCHYENWLDPRKNRFCLSKTNGVLIKTWNMKHSTKIRNVYILLPVSILGSNIISVDRKHYENK